MAPERDADEAPQPRGDGENGKQCHDFHGFSRSP
jgi:hypothetical protein